MRKDSREIAFKLIFQYLFTEKRDDELKVELVQSDEFDLSPQDILYAEELYTGVLDTMDTLKEDVKAKCEGYDISRIYKTDLSVLLLAAFELKYEEEIPKAVVINEAVNIAKKYGTDKSHSFVNGVLKKF